MLRCAGHALWMRWRQRTRCVPSLGMDTERPDILPLPSMARLLRVPQKWLQDECDAGRIPHLKTGSGYLFDVPTVERAILARLRESATPAKAVARG